MRAVIIEDEALAREYLSDMLDKIAPDIKVVKTLDNVREAISWLNANEVDLLFMDIHLGDDTSFAILEKVELKAPIIFTTAYNQYAIKAFKLNSIDYLLKPFTEKDLKWALDKFKSQKMMSGIDLQALIQAVNPKHNYKERFMVMSGQKIKMISISQVAYFVSEGRYSRLFTFQNEKFLLDESLSALEHVLDPKLFFRVNRQIIVSLQSIQQMVVWSRSRLRLDLLPPTDFEVIVSIDHSGEFKKWLNG